MGGLSKLGYVAICYFSPKRKSTPESLYTYEYFELAFSGIGPLGVPCQEKSYVIYSRGNRTE